MPAARSVQAVLWVLAVAAVMAVASAVLPVVESILMTD